MKKMISLALILTLLMGLCACASKGESAATTEAAQASAALKVGFAKANITPEYSVPLAGYGNSSTRMANGFLDYIYTMAIAISDGENTVIIIENDLASSVEPVMNNVRTKVSNKTGIPMENIMTAVDHIHTGPDLWNTAESSIGKYTQEVIGKMVDTALAAVADMKPVTVTSGEAQVQDLNFVRHYYTEDGHVRGPNFGLQYNSPKVGHTHEPDRQLQVVSFQQEGGKEIVLVNFQAHPQMATSYDYNSITADTIGAMRNQVMSKRECEVFYVLGASGDVQAISLIDSENRYADHKAYGVAFGDAVLDILNGEMAPLSLGEVKTAETIYMGVVDKSENHKVVEARAIMDEWNKTNDYDAAVAAGVAVGINSPYHAKGILSRSNMGDSEEVLIYAFGIGELGFVFAPYEMFCENGAYIKENSPYSRTIVCSMANDSFDYISAAAGFDYNCYEANNGRFVKGTGEELAEAFVQMLQGLK